MTIVMVIVWIGVFLLSMSIFNVYFAGYADILVVLFESIYVATLMGFQ